MQATKKDLEDRLRHIEEKMPKGPLVRSFKEWKVTILSFQGDSKGDRSRYSGNAEVSAAAGDLQRGIRAFELLVIEASQEWEAEKRKLTPELKAQRRLWIDFLSNPKVLEANVDAMIKKASLAAAKD